MFLIVSYFLFLRCLLYCLFFISNFVYLRLLFLSFANSLSILLILPKKLSLSFVDIFLLFFYLLFDLFLFKFSSLCYFLPSPDFGLVLFFPLVLWDIKLVCVRFFLNVGIYHYEIFCYIAFGVFRKCLYVVLLFSFCLEIFLKLPFLKNNIMSVQVFVIYFPSIHEFSIFLLLIISNFIPLWPEKILGMFLIFLNVRLFGGLSHKSWFFCDRYDRHIIYLGECSMSTWEECVFFFLWVKLLYMSVRFIWSIVMFKSTVSLLIFFLLSVMESLVVESPPLLCFCWFLPSSLLIFALHI